MKIVKCFAGASSVGGEEREGGVTSKIDPAPGIAQSFQVSGPTSRPRRRRKKKGLTGEDLGRDDGAFARGFVCSAGPKEGEKMLERK